MGGLVIGQEIARQAGARYLFAEKIDGDLALRRGFILDRGEPALVVEDVITRGGRAQEALDVVRRAGGTPGGLAVLVDRSGGGIDFGVPLTSLIEMSFPTFHPDELPEELKAIPPVKPGS